MATPAPLDERKSAILRAIVSHYVRSGEPAGSRTISERSKLGVSSATIRNEMGALEDAGYIYQPHTSAGRIPTDAGYRYFVDQWARDGRLAPADAEAIRRFFGEPRWALEDSLRHTASLLSHITNHAAVVFAPALGPSTVRHVDVAGLSQGRAMVVLVAVTGRVDNYIISIPDTLDEGDLARTTEVLNRIATGVPLEKTAATIRAALDQVPHDLRELVATVVSTLDAELTERETERVFLEGASTIVDESKFADLETVRQVIGALEHRRLLLEVLADALSTADVSVRIGSENLVREMQNCSVVTAPYEVDGSSIGSLGVVGPTRMDYRRTIAAVHEVASNLGRMLRDLV